MASIVEKRIDLPFHRCRFEYEWPGEEITASLSHFSIERAPLPLLTRGETFWLGDLELVVVDYFPEAALYQVALASGRGFQAMYRRRIYYFWEALRSRIILTFFVWGLADLRDVSFGERLTWKHIDWGRK